MNDTPITDFDKLKNTLIEIGVEFDVDQRQSFMMIYGEDNPTILRFTPDGKYNEECNED